MRLWDKGITQYLKGRYASAAASIEAAGAMHPGFLEVERVKEDIASRLEEQPYLERRWVQRLLLGVALVVAVIVVRVGVRWGSAALTRRIRAIVQEDLRQGGAKVGV